MRRTVLCLICGLASALCTADTAYCEQILVDYGSSVTYVHPAAASNGPPFSAIDYDPFNTFQGFDFDSAWFTRDFVTEDLEYFDGTLIPWQQGFLPIGFGNVSGIDEGITGHDGFATELATPSTGNAFTTYYRIPFHVPDSVPGQIVMEYLIKDGAAVYLDGQMVAQLNCCKEGIIPLDFPPFYTSTALDSGMGSQIESVVLSPTGLDEGEHFLAISLHPNSHTDVATGLDFRIVAVPEPDGGGGNVDPLDVDFDGNGVVNTADVDGLVNEIVTGGNDSAFDLNGDSVVNRNDLSQWLSDAATENGFADAYLSGDANLDGTVDETDLNFVGPFWQLGVSVWSVGDFTADGQVNASDLNFVGLHWQQSIAAAAQPAAVPEPDSLGLITLAGLAFLSAARRR